MEQKNKKGGGSRTTSLHYLWIKKCEKRDESVTQGEKKERRKKLLTGHTKKGIEEGKG